MFVCVYRGASLCISVKEGASLCLQVYLGAAAGYCFFKKAKKTLNERPSEFSSRIICACFNGATQTLK